MSSGSIGPMTSDLDIGDILARKHPLEAVLFDFDGTLIDTGGLILASFRHTMREALGRDDLSDEELMRNVGVPLLKQMEEFAPGRGEELVAVYRKHNHAHHDEIAEPFEGVDALLSGVRDLGLPIGIVTSKGQVAFGMGERLIGLDGKVDLVVTADDVHTHKPDPFPLVYAADKLGVDVTRTVYVGDSPHDMAAAKAAGSVAVAALWGMFSEESLVAESPDHVASSPREVLELLVSLVG